MAKKKQKVDLQAGVQQEAAVLPPMDTKTELKPRKDERQTQTAEQWQELFRFLNFRVMELKQEQAQAHRMLPETKKQLLDAWHELFAFLGFPPLPDARDSLLEMLKTEGHANEELASRGFMTGLLAGLFLILERHCESLEEPSPEELEKTLAAINRLRYQFKGIFKKSTANMARALPHDPGGGPRRFKEEESTAVCHEIAQLYEKGKLLKAAYKLLAKKYDTSPRTIQRTWQQRPKLTE